MGGRYRKGRSSGEIHECTTAGHPVNVAAAIFTSLCSVLLISHVEIDEGEHDTHILPSLSVKRALGVFLRDGDIMHSDASLFTKEMRCVRRSKAKW